jgi:hypothetical protein
VVLFIFLGGDGCMARTVKLAVYEPDKGEVNDLLKQKGIYKKRYAELPQAVLCTYKSFL